MKINFNINRAVNSSLVSLVWANKNQLASASLFNPIDKLTNESSNNPLLHLALPKYTYIFSRVSFNRYIEMSHGSKSIYYAIIILFFNIVIFCIVTPFQPQETVTHIGNVHSVDHLNKWTLTQLKSSL